MLPSCPTHTLLQRYLLACVRSRRCPPGIRDCSNELLRTRLSPSSISLHHFCVFGPCMLCHTGCFFLLISLLIRIQHFLILQTVTAKPFDYSLFLILTIFESHSEAEQQLLTDFIGFRATMRHDVTAAVSFPRNCVLIRSLDSLEWVECGTQSAEKPSSHHSHHISSSHHITIALQN